MLRSAPYHLLAGEETAFVTFGAMLRAAGPGEPVYGAVEVAESEDRLPLPRGEARTVQAVRAHLVGERGWPRRSVQVKPYWTPGRRGMD